MAKRRNRPSLNIFSLSFMDVISCGFGAVILLFIMNDTVRTEEVVELREDRTEEYERLQDKRAAVRAETRSKEVETEALGEVIREAEARLEELENRRRMTESQLGGTDSLDARIKAKEEAITVALQERDRLRDMPPPWRTDLVGGIPADSEYIIFIIDTSGSMQSQAKFVAQMLQETLAVYPRVKGIQLMNADGVYLDPARQGGWFPGNSAGRVDVLKRYINWNRGSSSSPIGGILTALRDYGKTGLPISLYIFGDDFAGGKVDELIEAADNLNPVLPNGDRAFRIHAVGFPTALGAGGRTFAGAMRELTQRHGGAFVGVTPGQER